jgi:hypothetical protein
MEMDFITECVSEWPELLSLQNSMENLKALNVVNDRAERGIKLTSDYLEASRSEEHFQGILQIIEENSKEMPNL